MRKFTYGQAVKYLDDCLIFGIKPSLARINKILELMGDPHKKTDFIHIVGTNGKTSTTIMTANMLWANGIRCGYHISPHITRYTERLWYCGSNISKSAFAGLLSDLYPFIEKVNRLDIGGPITQFEIIAAMAFKLAFDENLDVMVLEAGMGGRWDATNAADSKVVGLTGVNLEHTAILGKTIRKIAIEKSQVIKKNTLVATLSDDEKVLDVLRQQVFRTGSALYLFGRDFFITSCEKKYLEGWKVSIRTTASGTESVYKDIFIPLMGNYQPHNLALSIVLCELYFKTSRRKIDMKASISGLANIKVPGRFEILRKNPIVVADTSHNPAGVANFVKNIKENFAHKRIIAIFSVLKDKDHKKMLLSIVSIADVLILTSSNTQRSLSVDILEKELYDIQVKVPDKVYKRKTITDSLNYALKIADSSDIICITGSITNLEGIVS